ncbi:TlpA family protein disulfide reductase [Rubritalea sp.]|uniref:TlpA family protein disulfide reductase n=1 Tax=Rubritalea sp. TaxID=2109375 RepID=UPI003EF80A73
MKFIPKTLLKAVVISSLATSALSLTQLQAQDATAEISNLTVGSDAPALEGITWIQGDPIKSLDEKGKVYMLELWATWCGPCVQIIPHVNEWDQKYKSKGLVVIGMNVFEDDIETVKKFVESQGDAMSYRVAFSGGQGSPFESNWLRPAGIQGIPHALLIKDGKIIFKGHPGGLDDTTIESMLAGDFDAAKFAAEAAETEKSEAELREKITPLFEAQDWDGIIAVAEKLDDSNPAKLQLTLTAVSQKSDWDALSKIRADIATDPDSLLTVTAVDENAALGMKTGKGAKEYATLALEDQSAIEGPVEQQIPSLIAKARLQFLSGDTESSAKTIAQAKELAAKVEDPQFKTQVDLILPAIETSMKDGKFPSIQEVMQGQ